MPWGLGGLGRRLYNAGSAAYNAAPNLGVSSLLSRGYQALPPILPDFSNNSYMDFGPIPGSNQSPPPPPPPPAPPQNMETFPTVSEPPSPALMSAGLGSLGSNVMSGLGSVASSAYNSVPSLSSISSGISSAYNSMPSVSSMAGSAASGLGSLAGRAAGSAINMIPEQRRTDAFENVGAKIGSQIGAPVANLANNLPMGLNQRLGIGQKFNDYTTNFGRQFGNYLSSQFSNNPQSSFGGFKNIGATLGGAGLGTLGGTGLGAVGGSALGGYLGGKLGKYGAPIGKVLGGLLGGGLGALGGGLGGGYLGNRFTKFKHGGPAKANHKVPKLGYNKRLPQGRGR